MLLICVLVGAALISDCRQGDKQKVTVAAIDRYMCIFCARLAPICEGHIPTVSR
jgi:hypothetical protein